MRLRLQPTESFPFSQQINVRNGLASVAALTQEIGNALGLDPGTRITSITVFDSEFEEWIVPKNASELRDGTEIQVEAAAAPPEERAPPVRARSRLSSTSSPRSPPRSPLPARSGGGGGQNKASSQRAAAGADLSALRPSALRKRCLEAGATEEEIEHAEDSGDAKQAMVDLVLAKTPLPTDSCAGGGGGGAVELQLRRELASMKPSALRRRAQAAGAREDEIEAAEDAEDQDPRAAMVDLIVAMTAPDVAEAAEGAARQRLVLELSGLKPSALRKRAAAAGATEAELEEAADADDPNAAMVELIVDREAGQREGAGVGWRQKAALIAELSTLKPSALRKRAVAAGVSGDEIDDAEDSGDPTAAMIALIVSASGGENGGGGGTRWGAKQQVLLTRELSSLKPSALRRRALEAGVDEAAIEAAEDSDDPKTALVSLAVRTISSLNSSGPAGIPIQFSLRSHVPVELAPPSLDEKRGKMKARKAEREAAAAAKNGGEKAADEAAAQTRSSTSSSAGRSKHAELAQLKNSELLQRARAAGAAQEALDEVADSEDQKAALVSLVTGLLAADSDGLEQRRAELEQFKVSELLQRARAAGVAKKALDEASDSGDPKGVLVGLMLEAANTETLTQANKNAAEHKLRAELESLKVSDLLQRARAVGMAQKALDEAADSDDQKQVLVGLLLEAEMDEPPKPTPARALPHFRALGSVAAAKDSAFTVMLSYEWDSQNLVIEVCKALQAKGVTCWMDIDGGMKRDVSVHTDSSSSSSSSSFAGTCISDITCTLVSDIRLDGRRGAKCDGHRALHDSEISKFVSEAPVFSFLRWLVQCVKCVPELSPKSEKTYAARTVRWS